MGLYDYLGDTQVKCFPVPVVKLNKPPYHEYNKEGLGFFSLSGSLKSYPRGCSVPYKTLYYNYGKDFMVFDYRTFDYDTPEDYKFDEKGLLVHIIVNGRYHRSVSYNKLPKRYKIGLVLDNYGDVLNINTINDFKEIVYSWRCYQKKRLELEKEALKPYGVKFSIFELADKLSKEEYLKAIEENTSITNEIYDKTLRVFRDTWYKNDKEIEKTIFGGWTIGGIYETYLRGVNFESDWYKILPYVDDELKKSRNTNLFFELGAYSVWCIQNKIDVNINELFNFIDNYLNNSENKV